MTLEENKKRAADKKVQYIKEHLYDKDKGNPFVFISYKSDDWETALQDVVYRLVKDYGLHVYFDGSFDSHNSLWIEQFPENMKHSDCKGVLAFLDDKYATSYATVLELMYSQYRPDEWGDLKEIPVIPVNLGKLTKITDRTDTGLGKDVYEDNTRNINAASERDLFDRAYFALEKKKNMFANAINTYSKKGGTLTKLQCSVIMADVLAYCKVNDNFYEKGGSLENIVNSIKDACGPEVFGKVTDSNPEVFGRGFHEDPPFSSEKIGQHIRGNIRKLISENKMTEELISNCLDLEYSKTTFHIGYPFLREEKEGKADQKGNNRYWSDVVSIHGKNYYMCSEWYEKHRKFFDEWLASIGTSASEGKQSDEEIVTSGQDADGKTKKSKKQEKPEGKNTGKQVNTEETKDSGGKRPDNTGVLKIGQYVQKNMQKLIEEGKITEELVSELLDLGYSKRKFCLNYPFLRAEEEGRTDQKGNNRYWSNVISIHGKNYYMCSEWYETSQKNQRMDFDAWLDEVGLPVSERIGRSSKKGLPV